ncbi:uncharacterized protein EV422DRAFT_585444 [Fimicolochytrium jonesii]|uniref:uncharacterized protein n=1 Tax=Fimicolochytrium jonesii TaxID=1396493 RepID=UPI0022FF090C|nr:uncharacterized protein EV422DRAFT_585444 [Fimicolochytrium jonesii]KAI8822927.1 hypothetical protein EV422DRAFT_585444 [Fimicolochytrium jonesii]
MISSGGPDVEVGPPQKSIVDFANLKDGHSPLPSMPAVPPLPRQQGKAKDTDIITTPNRQDRRLQFGIDCAEMVHFTHWEPGGEHIKQLVVKNVVMKTQKIKYKLPQTRYFSMEFPETMTLSAGMSWTIPITFRPVAKENYHDVLEFATSFGKFYVPVKATLPEHVLDFPSTTDFSLCPIRETAKKTFLLTNTGELGSDFEWSIPRPFAISPRSGTMAPNAEISVTIDFKPEDASVFNATAVCTFGDRRHWESSKTAKAMGIHGIGKYSFLAIEGGQHTFDFGEVFVGKTVERRFVIWNYSAVAANFRIKQPEDDADPYFDFSTLSGTIPPHKSFPVTISFTPAAASMRSTDYFDIKTLSGNTIRITCTGRGIGPKVTLSTEVVNFNDVPAGTTVTRALHLANDSGTSAFYQFLVEPNSIFRIDKPYGTINPHSSVALTIKFSASEPINYYRRVYCLVEHHDGLVLDILATCYNDKRRPATFLYKHVENYESRRKNGLWNYGPEQLEEMMKNGIITCNGGPLQWSDPAQAEANRSNHISDSTYPDCTVASDYFYEGTTDCEPVTLVDTHVEFGSCSRYKVIDSRTIRISNNTSGKMSCVWIMPGETSGQDSVFSVTPTITDILPRSTAEFRINFRPKIDNSIFGAHLECFVYFKSMRNFRLVNEDTFTPPWCVTPLVTGNTFMPGTDSFIPKINFGAMPLDFPPCHVDKSMYRTIRVTNDGDTPAHYAVIDGSLRGIGGGTPLASMGGAAFTVKPRAGILHKGESRLLVFRFSPSEQRIFEQALKCAFNSSAANTYVGTLASDIHVKGVGYFPHLTFGSDNAVCFKPTCVGAIARRGFVARNTSKISVKFEWHIPHQYGNLVAVQPVSGTLLPNESMEFECSFAPNAVRNWVMKLPCYFCHEPDESSDGRPQDMTKRRSTLTVIGQGINGSMEASPDVLDLGAVLVNSIIERDVLLSNPTACDALYELEITRKTRKPQQRSENRSKDNLSRRSKDDLSRRGDAAESLEHTVSGPFEECGIEIKQLYPILPARSHQALRVKLCLREQQKHEFTVYYRLKLQSLDSRQGLVPSQHNDGLSERQHLFDITALGVHPLVQVTDIRCEGYSKSYLWELFSLEKFNNVMASVDPSPTVTPINESSFPTDQQPAYRYSSSANIQGPSVDFDFGAAPLRSKETVYHVNLHNSGVVPVEWVYYFPNDLQIEVEQWADPGDYSEEQLHYNFIMDNELFSIQPKNGWLDPQESVHVTVTYSHEHPGHHKIPVVFKLRNGTTQSSKEVVINFLGYTANPDAKCLHFHETVHEFHPVEVGVLDPPVQKYHIVNRGLVSVEYTLDLTPLEQIKRENHNVDIFECRRTSGYIAPGESESFDWVFRPIEAKEYEVDIPITVTDGQTQIITFRGRGVDFPTVEDPEDRTDPQEYGDIIPPIQLLEMPEQLAKLSKERINFGHMPTGATVRNIVVVTNLHESSEVSFKWIVPETVTGGKPLSSNHGGLSTRALLMAGFSFLSVLSFTPQSGILHPSETQVCKVSLTPSFFPEMFLVDVVCEIMDETALHEYNTARDTIETARREGRPLSVVEPLLRRDSVAVGSGGSLHDLTKMKYRTLPPISPPPVASGTKVEAATAAGQGGRRPSSALSVGSDIGLLGLPPPPEPSLLFLAIVGRSHPVEECRALYSGYEGFFYNRRSERLIADVQSPVFTSPTARATIHAALSSILDDVFQDPTIQNLPGELRQDPPPYYAQMVTGRKINGIELQRPVDSGSSEEESLERTSRVAERIDGVLRWVISLSEFQNLVASVLEGTLYNLMQEANLEEFDLTKEQMAVVLP